MRTAREISQPVPRLDRGGPTAPLCERLREGLRQQIVAGCLKPGDAVMPVRQLCKELGLNRVTADQAIRDLILEGLLRSEHGRGVFVNDLTPFRVVLAANLSGENPGRSAPGGYRSMLAAACEELARSNVHTETLSRRARCKEEKFGPRLETVLSAKADGYMPIGIQNEEYLEALTATKRPVVALDAAPLKTSFDGIVLDTFRTGYLAARHLLELGHRHIVFVGYDRGPHPGDPEGRTRIPEPDSERMAAGFAYALKEAGVSREGTKGYEFFPRKGESRMALARDLRSGGYTAAILVHGQAEELKAARELPMELSVVVTEAEIHAESARAWTRVELDEKEFGRWGARRMLQRLVETRKGIPGPAGGSLSTIEPVLVAGPTTRRIGPPPPLYAYQRLSGTNALKEDRR